MPVLWRKHLVSEWVPPTRYSEERRILQLPKIKEVMFDQGYWLIGHSRHIPVLVTFPSSKCPLQNSAFALWMYA